LTARPIPPRHHPGTVLLAVVLPPLHLLHVGGELVFDGAVLHVLQTAVADLAGAGAARRRPLRAGLQLQEDARFLDGGGVVGRETLSVVEGAPSYALEVLPELVHFAGRLRGVDLDRDEFGAGGGRLRVGLPQIGVRRVLDPVHVLQVLLLDVCPAERREGLVPAKDVTSGYLNPYDLIVGKAPTKKAHKALKSNFTRSTTQRTQTLPD
jgi:hypothetical protein